MHWYAVHGRPVFDEDDQLRAIEPIFRETHFAADDQPSALRIMDAIANEVIVEYGQPIVAYMDRTK